MSDQTLFLLHRRHTVTHTFVVDSVFDFKLFDSILTQPKLLQPFRLVSRGILNNWMRFHSIERAVSDIIIYSPGLFCMFWWRSRSFIVHIIVIVVYMWCNIYVSCFRKKYCFVSLLSFIYCFYILFVERLISD